MANNLIIYYSRKGENYVGGKVKSLEKGNTEVAAEFIQKAVGGDLFEVKTVKSYPEGYKECIEECKKELHEKARPELVQYLDNIDAYDNIFICGPCWWGTFPMAVFSLIEKLDFTGKKVIPLMTHEGSRMGSSERDLRHMCKGAKVVKGLPVHGAETADSEKEIAEWAKKACE
jgi:flavodoxin